MNLRGIFNGFPEHMLKWNEPLREHTSFKVGGAAALMILPSSKALALEAIRLARENSVEHFVMGNGSNLLVRDTGYRGVVIKISDNMNAVHIKEHSLTAEAGASLARIAALAMNARLAGLEFASGIPGSLGGAICMNAGAYGSEMADILALAEVIDSRSECLTLTNEQLDLSYRASRVQREGLIVLEAVITLDDGDMQAIKMKMRDLNERRREKQPLEFPSAGSTFKRPEGDYAGRLIMNAGLAGYAVGGARVSEKHCGFIINTGGASADDILRLMLHVTETVHAKFGVTLEPEVKILG